MTITVTAITAPATCTHPREARTTRPDDELARYDVCAACASEALVCTADCNCAQCRGEAEPAWMPILNPDDVPAEHLEAAGLAGASVDEVDEYLTARNDAWKAAKAEAEIRADERRKCAQELRDYANRRMQTAMTFIIEGDDAKGLPMVSRAAAIDSAAKLLEEG